MKLILSLGTGLLATYAALVLAIGNFDVISSAACRPDFTLPDLACRSAGLGTTLAAVPFCGVIAMIVTWAALSRKQRQ